MKMSKSVFAAFLAGMMGLSVQALVVDQDMTVTSSQSGIEFSGDYTLTVEGAGSLGTVVNNGHRVTIRLNSNTQVSWIEGHNGSYTRVEFNGGALTDAGGWGTAWFKPDATSTVELASIEGNPILIQHPNAQWKYLLEGKGCVCTSGSGPLEIATSGVHNGTILYCYMNIGSSNYCHTGGTLLRGNNAGITGNIRFNSANCMPPGEVSLGSSSHKCILYMDGTSQVADRIIAYGTSVLTNDSSSVVSSLVFTNDNSCLDAALTGGRFSVTMRGSAATDVFTMKTPRVNGVFTVERGRAVVQQPRSGGGTYCGNIRLCKDAVLEIDGIAVTTELFMNEGGEIVYRNGGTLTITKRVDGSALIIDVEGEHVAGSSSFVKSGAGTLYVAGNTRLEADEYHVAEGTMKFVGPTGTTNHWWRFTARQSATAGGTLSIGPVRLLDVNCNFADGGNNASGGGGYEAVAESVSPTDYQPKQYYCSSTDCSNRTPDMFFGSSSVFECTFRSPKPKESDPSTWITWTYRIANANVEIRGYNLKTQWGDGSQWPRSWKIESSPSGADGTWVLMDERSGYTEVINGQQWYHNGGYGVGGNDNHPSTKISFDGQGVPTLPSKGGVAAESSVRVDRGATLDCSQCETRQELGALTVDCADGTGVGTLKNVKLASTGVIRLLNVSSSGGMVLPLEFVDSATSGSLARWTVYVNGEECAKRILAWQDGNLTVQPQGLLMIVR